MSNNRLLSTKTLDTICDKRMISCYCNSIFKENGMVAMTYFCWFMVAICILGVVAFFVGLIITGVSEVKAVRLISNEYDERYNENKL